MLAASLGAAGRAWALDDNGAPIDTSEYTLDLYEGPNLANARLVGLAGSFSVLAPGVQGFSYNPSSVVAREPWSVTWFDWEVDAGVTLPASVTNFDFDNNGDQSFANEAALFGMLGGRLQFGDFGVGLSLDANLYDVRSKISDQELDVTLARVLLVAGYSFLDGEILAGIGVSVNNVNLSTRAADGTSATLASVNGPALHLGATWAPAYAPVQVGASVRLAPPASWLPDAAPEGVTPDESGNYTTEGYVLPRTIALPTEIHAGVAFQLFRPLSFPFVNPRDEDSEARRAQAEIAAERNERAEERARRLREAKEQGTEGEALEALEEALEREEERFDDEASDRLDRAKELDRARRLVPYKTMPREKVLVSAAVKVTTITTNGVGVESFLRQVVERSGEKVTVSPRLGVEAEVVPAYLVVRGGSYVEPSRFRTSSFRVHGTGGLDVRIPVEWSVFGLFDDDTTFRVGGAIDAASRYFGWGVSAGIWR